MGESRKKECGRYEERKSIKDDFNEIGVSFEMNRISKMGENLLDVKMVYVNNYKCNHICPHPLDTHLCRLIELLEEEDLNIDEITRMTGELMTFLVVVGVGVNGSLM
jgi:hypothetical protein